MSKEYKRQGYAPDLSDCDNIVAVTDILLSAARCGRPASYPESEQGFEDFQRKTIDYIIHVQEINKSDDVNKKVIPDIESWACYLGITRATLAVYERKRDGKWKQYISMIKNGIAAVKKEAAFHSQTNAMIALFDFTNNHEYVNTSEFKLNTNNKQEDVKVIPANEPIFLEVKD